MDEGDSMRSIQSRLEAEWVEKRSRFLGFLIPVSSEDEAKSTLTELRHQHPLATHVCYAYQIGDQAQQQKYDDDGEPTKTAGIPILEVLKKNDMTNTLAVVIRYFGGVLLGASGLVRAYTKAISNLIPQVTWTEKHVYERCLLSLDYHDHHALTKRLEEMALIESTLYQEKVLVKLSIESTHWISFQQEIEEKTSARANVQWVETYSAWQ